MAGEYLLVAPLFTGQTTRKVVLPKGNWYDFYTGEYAGNGEVLTVTPGWIKFRYMSKTVDRSNDEAHVACTKSK
jgi:hypothetical protein